MGRGRWIAAAGVALAILLGASSPQAAPAHALAMHGAPMMPADFQAFPYANPDAPKGGRVTYGVQGAFDSLNPFIVKGVPARGLRDGGQENYVYESMMLRGYGEAFTLYCLICETVDVPDDRSSITFRIRPEAAFSDGHQLRAEDVLHSLEILRTRARPNMTTPYKKVVKAESPDPLTVRFEFADGSDREIALIMGLMPILPKHAMSAEEFDKTSLKPPVGSGPYVVADVKPGSQLTLKRNPGYWGRDLPVKRGFDNYDEIRFDYYRNDTTLFEAFKAGQIDILPEGDASRWTSGYSFPAVADGRVIKDTFETGSPKPMAAIVFNTRRPLFQDVRVREALARLYDFEWVNANLYYGLYRRTMSFFETSELSSIGRPADETERKLLAAFPGLVRDDVLEGRWKPAATDGTGRDRAVLRSALDLLGTAGWKINQGVLRNAAGEPMRFELVMQSVADQEKMALAWQRSLKLLGIDVTIRSVEDSEYQLRRTKYDFDATFWVWASSLSPGNEQNFRWSSAAADVDGTFNLAGVKSAGVDALIKAMLTVRTRSDFVSTVRAYDRALISGFYVLPLQHQPGQWVARWSRIERPKETSVYGAVMPAWWVKPGGSP